MNKRSLLIEALQGLDERERSLLLALIITKGNKSEASFLAEMPRNRYSIEVDISCEKVKNFILEQKKKNGHGAIK